ncbi:hypothetical protein TWF694_008307 [Orbilia ellipsospora]|uniref:Uncharacterized protein n=1 Tax=Orbilia ellipsospora TaxID=2528407 RepID=A0AAV9XFP7_9PEZI
MPRPTQRISALHPFSHQARQSIDDSSLPNLPHPPSPPSNAESSSTATSNPVLRSNSQRYSAIPLISSVTEFGPNGESDSFSYTNNLNTGVYNSLSRIPSYRLPSPVSLPSRHNSRIQRDRGMSASPVSSISAVDAPITNRYSYLIQPLPVVSQSPSPPDMPLPPPPPSQDQVSAVPTMGVPLNTEYLNIGHSSRLTGPLLTPINESTPNLPGSSHQSQQQLPLQEIGYAAQDPTPLPPVVTYDVPAPQNAMNTNTTPAPPRSAFQRMNDFAGRQFSSVRSNFVTTRRPSSRPISLSQFVRRRRHTSSHPPTPSLAIIGVVTSSLVFIALMVFLWESNFAANIVAIVYSFSVLSACSYVLVRYNQKKRRNGLDVERGGSRMDLFGRSGANSRFRTSLEGVGSQPNMEMVQESEIIVIPRMPVHRTVGEGEADPELPPYSRGNAAEILDVPVPPPP